MDKKIKEALYIAYNAGRYHGEADAEDHKDNEEWGDAMIGWSVAQKRSHPTISNSINAKSPEWRKSRVQFGKDEFDRAISLMDNSDDNGEFERMRTEKSWKNFLY